MTPHAKPAPPAYTEAVPRDLLDSLNRMKDKWRTEYGNVASEMAYKLAVKYLVKIARAYSGNDPRVFEKIIRTAFKYAVKNAVEYLEKAIEKQSL